MEDGEYRNWLELPPELTSSILHRIGAIEILENAQKVCKAWRDVCRETSMWQIIDVSYMDFVIDIDPEIMCRHAIDRSQGGLIDLKIGKFFCTDDLLQYIADSLSNLRRLSFVVCHSGMTDEVLAEAFKKFPLLEDLEIPVYRRPTGPQSLKVIGQSCPHLKTLKLNSAGRRRSLFDCDENALAIAENMPGLRYLQLFGERLTDTGLNAILENCLHLEHLDLSKCFNSELSKNLEKRCSERIKVVKLPEGEDNATVFGDPPEGDPDGFSYIDLVSDDED